ncbi:MAG: hypothetical protein NTW86_11430 [Candidatus Sumerlaeota bacterium]|nr:hypothetical protein [Candidatus Sumerlaeota bacterium]
MSHSHPAPRFPWLLCAFFVALGAALRFWQLGEEALFYDEFVTWKHCVSPSFHAFLQSVWRSEGTPSLAFLITRWFAEVLGDSPAALRLPAALFGAATVWAMMRVLYETGAVGRFPFFVMGALVAVNPFDIYYSQEARPYAAQVFFVACHLIYAIRVWRAQGETPARGDLIGLAATGALAVATHLFSVFVLVFSFGLILLRQAGYDGTSRQWRFKARGDGFPRRVLAALLLLAAIGVAAVGLALSPGPTERTQWLPPYHWTFAIQQWRAMVEGPFLTVAPAVALPLSALVWVAALAAAGRPPAAAGWRDVWAVCWLALAATAALPHVAGVCRRMLVNGQRYEIICLPAFWLVTALPAAWSRRPRTQALLLALLLTPALWYFSSYYRFRQKAVWDKAAQICRDALQPSDIAWDLAPPGGNALLYYLRGAPFGVATAPRLDAFPAPPAPAMRVALAAKNDAALGASAPPGFTRRSGTLLETHQPGQEISVAVFERTPQAGKEAWPARPDLLVLP